ncbi:MAG: PDZ domain-containing protein [Clostridia bacterium]|nr:PDZ domain-containing protein [Clostridia bacterium]
MDFFNEEYNRHVEYNQNRTNNVPPPPTQNTQNKPIRTLLVIFLMVAVFVVGILVGSLTQDSSEWGLLKDIVKEYKNNSIYYDEATWDTTFKQMIVNAGTYMLQTTDSYGFVLSPQELYDVIYPTDGATPTYGMGYAKYKNLGYYVTSVSYGSGAYRANLQVGDVIMFINRSGFDEVDLRSASDTQVAQIMSGDWGTQLDLTVLRGFSTLNSEGGNLSIMDIMIKKVPYDTNFVDYYFGANSTDMDNVLKTKLNVSALDGTNVGYIRLNGFDAVYDANQNVVDSSSMQFEETMAIFKTKYNGQGKLILDLRGNPGGSVSEAVAIASYLIYDYEKPNTKKYLVTTLRGQNDAIVKTYYTQGNYFTDYFDTTTSTPKIVVLTDRNSASASELLLGCILDYNTGVQVGETSYGKGIAQTVEYLLDHVGQVVIKTSDGTTKTTNFYYGIYYTFAKYYSPVNNRNIHGIGYTPTEKNIVNTNNTLALLNRAKQILN